MAAETMAEGGRAERGHWLNEARIRGHSRLIVAIFGIGFLVWLGLSLPGLVDPRGKPFGYDFMAYWSAARLVLAGRAGAVFSEAALRAVQHAAVASLPNIWYPWQYPPIFLLFVTPLGLLPYAAALALFVPATLLLWAALVRRVLPDRRAWIVAAATPAGLITLLDGQNAFLTASLAGFALLWLERRPFAAGMLIGLLAVKPQLAVLFPLALLAAGRWRTIAGAALTVLALVAASVAAFGWQGWLAFLHHLPLTQAMAAEGLVPWRAMPTGFVFALSLGASQRAAWVLQGAVALVAAGCVWRAWRSPAAPFEARAATLLAGSLLVSPVLFYYDLLWAALAVAWLVMLARRTGFRRGEREIFLCVWAVPIVMEPIYMLTSVQLGFPAVVVLLLVALRRAAPPGERELGYLRRALDLLREARWLTRERLMPCGFVFAAMSIGLLAWTIHAYTANGLTSASGNQLGWDFIIWFASAKAAALGVARLVYDQAWFQAFENAITGPGLTRTYGYTPVAMLLTLPLALFSFVPALIAWVLLGVGLCFALLRRLVGWREAALAAVGTPAAFYNLIGGQSGYFTAALLAGGLMMLERQPIIAGICFGCLSYKPQLGLLLPLALAADSRWRAFVAAAATVALLGAATLILFGPETWVAFIRHMAYEKAFMEFGIGAFWHRMPTVFVALRALGASLLLCYSAQLISAAAAVAALVVVWRSPASLENKAATLVVATFLATPRAWDYDTLILIFAAAWLGREGMRTGFLHWERLAIAALLVFPMITIVVSLRIGVQPGPLILWLILLLLLRRGMANPAPLAAAPLAASRATAQPPRLA